MPHNADGSAIAEGSPIAVGTFTEAVLAVEGIHCAACIQLIELRIGALPGIESISASPVTHRYGRAGVDWHPDHVRRQRLGDICFTRPGVLRLGVDVRVSAARRTPA